MKYEDLRSFVEEKMRMSHIYQPLLIKILVDSGGSATVRQLALSFLGYDESQIRYYESTLKNMPIKVLSKHGIIKKEGELVSLEVSKLSFEQKAELKKICEGKIQDYISKKGYSIWDHRLIDTCPFCIVQNTESILHENEHSFAILDKYPVSHGHSLIIPKRHIKNYLEFSQFELIACHDLIKFMERSLKEEDKTIKGFNIGLNNGEVAGQTIDHMHFHLIPRRKNDTAQPKGGVRGVIPKKMNY